MTDAFSSATTTLTKMIPVATTVGILHSATRKRVAPKRRATTRRRKVTASAIRKKTKPRKAARRRKR